MNRRVLLRAEMVTPGGARIVAHTLELSETSVFVEVDELFDVGAVLEVQLSFPRLVAPLLLAGRVETRRERTAPGEPQGVVLAFDGNSPDARARLAELLRALEEPPADEAPRDFHVLLVEDNHLIRDMFSYGIRKFFRGRDSRVNVDYAPDGAEAWKMLSEGAYDLAIVDYYLPVLDGAQLVKRMRAVERFADLPVVAVSVGGSEARDATLAAGADLFLDKPLVLKDLFATLQRLNIHGAAR